MVYNARMSLKLALRSMHSESEVISLPTSGQRGPVEHDRRAQIITVADNLFREYGYRKTSVADISKAMGISTAYVYRFFNSKQAIGEAICASTLEELDHKLREVVDLDLSPTRKLRLFMQTSLRLSYELLVVEREVNEVVVAAVEGNWCTAAGHKAQMYAMLELIIEQGRQAGEFERKTPIDEVTDGIAETIMPYTNARCLEQRSFSELEKGVNATTNLVLRSLAP
jgi:AcrR family transcriptional regulator